MSSLCELSTFRLSAVGYAHCDSRKIGQADFLGFHSIGSDVSSLASPCRSSGSTWRQRMRRIAAGFGFAAKLPIERIMNHL